MRAQMQKTSIAPPPARPRETESQPLPPGLSEDTTWLLLIFIRSRPLPPPHYSHKIHLFPKLKHARIRLPKPPSVSPHACTLRPSGLASTAPRHNRPLPACFSLPPSPPVGYRTTPFIPAFVSLSLINVSSPPPIDPSPQSKLPNKSRPLAATTRPCPPHARPLIWPPHKSRPWPRLLIAISCSTPECPTPKPCRSTTTRFPRRG